MRFNSSVVRRPGGKWPDGEEGNQWRFVTGCTDRQVRVWTADHTARPKVEAAQATDRDDGRGD